MIKANFLTLPTLIILLNSCNGANNQINKGGFTTIADKDSIALTTLVRKVYQWHMTKHLVDFPYKYEKPGDTIIVGINWDSYNKNIGFLKTSLLVLNNSCQNKFWNHENKNIIWILGLFDLLCTSSFQYRGSVIATGHKVKKWEKVHCEYQIPVQ
jgi:hypothetical protein